MAIAAIRNIPAKVMAKMHRHHTTLIVVERVRTAAQVVPSSIRIDERKNARPQRVHGSPKPTIGP